MENLPPKKGIEMPEEGIHESPSLGMHAADLAVEDCGSESDSVDENCRDAPSNGSHQEVDAGHVSINRDSQDLPCADPGDARVVDLAPEDSPLPLPIGAWGEKRASGRSISLPHLDGGCASRDSTPRMFAGGTILQ